ncbi:glycosyl hydrolase [Candidatus Kapabacteria bacterium]|nr:glycosyl hydrolase [Candidatus Kapabacteria bacterium]
MKSFFSIPVLLGCIIIISSCDMPKDILKTTEIIVTSEAGDKLAIKENVEFQIGKPLGTIISIDTSIKKQKILGIGTSFTESSAFVLAHLSKERRAELMNDIYGKDGANFSIARTHIGACDFSVEGKYSYVDKVDDVELNSFSLKHDKEGFSKEKYFGVKDESYDLIPFIKEALAIKESQDDKNLRIISSAWTAPKWMKDINEWYIPGSTENNWQGSGGKLKPEYESVYADYILKYLKEYKKEGIDIWGITPINEPHGNNGQWESMHFTAESQRDFIKQHLGPTLKKSQFPDTKLLIYDQNRGGLEHWANTILSDKEAATYVYGTAIHWYESTFKVFEESLNKVHNKFPEFGVIHTEGCIDDLGKDAPPGIKDPIKFKEENWFKNDDFWWNRNATDWAYTADWAENVEDHPIYTPVHRYARNIIVSLDNWLEGWIDWNIILDKDGGPNHVGNFCGAPIMIDKENQDIYKTPIFHVLSQFSRTIRPGDYALQTNRILDEIGSDDLYACATINSEKLLSVQLLNTTKRPIEFNLKILDRYANISIDANSIQTVRVQL